MENTHVTSTRESTFGVDVFRGLNERLDYEILYMERSPSSSPKVTENAVCLKKSTAFGIRRCFSNTGASEP
jgi:hypothetical protein